ncbi:MAG: YraN family protein [Nitrospirae bacterium]|nr:YraN family protein [Nitrospirota bacterium]MBF0540721.1 YraN family protein [Nitrospirota bacterium]
MLFKRDPSKKNILTGAYGERLAGNYLLKKGYKIIKKNYKNNVGEIDIIAMDGDKLVFVEVKTRKGDTFGSPIDAVDYKKQKKIINTALCFMRDKAVELPVRFDIIGVRLFSGFKKEIEHIMDVIEL